MSDRPLSFEVEAWAVRERSVDLDRLAETESVFALGNGHIGLRGNLDEGEPYGLPGTYLNGLFESRPLPYAEAGYGYPEAGQTVVDVTNGKLMRLLVDDDPFDIRYGDLHHHERLLDLRAGVLRRDVRWTSHGGKTVRVRSTRLVSLVQRAVMAIEYEVEAIDSPVRIVVQSELVANEDQPTLSHDPRVAAILDSPLAPLEHHSTDNGAYLAHVTKRSSLRLAVAMAHSWDAPCPVAVTGDAYEDSANTTFIADLQPGMALRIHKVVAYGWSGVRSVPALRDQVGAAVAAARHSGWDALVAEQRRYLDDFWTRADVQVDGDDEIQQAVRFSLFHVLQAGTRAETRAIPAKGLTGPGYDGHAFWDTESFVLPVLTYTDPRAAGHALQWRQSILPSARERAELLGLEGAAFPWRTIAGPECSAYWPAGTAAFHVNADIADAVRRYVVATGDEAFDRSTGTELLVSTARMWHSVGWMNSNGEFRIDGVTGPDEYSAIADNNVYTNLMAKRNLLEAAAAAERNPASCPDVDGDEIARWRAAATAMRVPFVEEMGVHPQSDGYLHLERWDFDRDDDGDYPLMLHYPYFQLYRHQVIKQADLVMALFMCGDEFSDEEKAADFDYYEALTVRDSSLSAAVQSIVAAEVGSLDLAYDYWGEAALMDLHDLEHNTRDGVHIAALAGAWLAAVNGFGGMRDHGGRLHFKPQLPPRLSRLAFNVCWRDGRLSVAIEPGVATYRWVDGETVRFDHYAQHVELAADEERRLSIPSRPARPRPSQPTGRAPRPRS